MTATVFSEAQHPFDGLLEALHQLSIDEVIVAQNQTILVGQVLGAIGVTSLETVTSAVGAGNVGTSSIGSVSATSASMNGAYQIVLLATSSTGAFEVQNPAGLTDGTGKIGTAYSGGVNFTITAGGTPTIGDTFTVTVVRPFDEGGEQFEAWGPGAIDGSQNASAIALFPCVTAASQTAKIAALRRDGAFRSSAVQFAAASFVGSTSTTTLTVTSMAPGSGPITLGATLAGSTSSAVITAAGTGTGGIGTYTISVSQTTAAGTAMTAAPTAAQIAAATQQLATKNIVLR